MKAAIGIEQKGERTKKEGAKGGRQGAQRRMERVARGAGWQLNELAHKTWLASAEAAATGWLPHSSERSETSSSLWPENV